MSTTPNIAAAPAETPPVLLDPLTMGPWTPESLDMLLGLSGVSGTAQRLTPAGTDYDYFEWSTPATLVSMPVWVFVMANEDPSPEDPTQWAWHFEVRTEEDFNEGRHLGSHKFRTRTEAVTLACEFLNVTEYLKTGAYAAREHADPRD